MIEVREVNVNEIVVEDRVRKGYGVIDQDDLERSIMSLGVLQPIGISASYKLIFGARRLHACKRLGMDTIPARIIDIDADDPVTALRMERDENEHRREFTPSERIEIGRRIEESMAGRRGRPSAEKVQNFAQLPQGKSSDIAAKAVDMNRETYRQAKAVVDSGDQEVIERMDKGELSIHGAYERVKGKKAKERMVNPTENFPEGGKGERNDIQENFPESSKGQARDKPQTFKITLHNPSNDAEAILSKGGKDYGVKLAIALLEAAGHKVDVERR